MDQFLEMATQRYAQLTDSGISVLYRVYKQVVMHKDMQLIALHNSILRFREHFGMQGVQQKNWTLPPVLQLMQKSMQQWFQKCRKKNSNTTCARARLCCLERAR